MLLDLHQNQLIITLEKTSLRPSNNSQLLHWGFKKNNSQTCFRLTENVEIILPKIIRYFNKNNIRYRLSESCLNIINIIESESQEFDKILKKGSKFKNGIIDKNDFRDHLSFLNKYIKRKLKPHQIKASFHLFQIQNGANFSVPGSGKTTVVISTYEKLRLEGKVNTLFVVGPAACFGPWKEEYNNVLGRSPKNLILAGGDHVQRKSHYYQFDNIKDLYLTTYQTLLNDQSEVCSFLMNNKINAFLVIDEAHYIKQINGNWAKAVIKISNHSNYRCVLTGTPIPNSYKDLFNIFDFLWPNIKPIDPKKRIQLQLCEEKKDNISAKKLLEPTIGPLFYRVRKSELGLKPQIFHDPILIPMNSNEKFIYEAIVTNIRRYSQEDYLQSIELIEKLRKGRMMRLRQCLSNAQLIGTSIKTYKENIIGNNSQLKNIIYKYDQLELPAKLTYLIDLVKKFKLNKKKVVIWSNFIGTIKLIENKFNENQLRCKKIIGDTPVQQTSINEEETREKIINEFKNKDSGLNILLANPAACSESISLHRTCHTSIYYDLSYNCAQYLQSLDRIHRVGGSENQNAHYYFLIYDKTIDLDILNTLNEKAKKMYEIIEGDYNIYSMDMFDTDDELDAYNKLFIEN